MPTPGQRLLVLRVPRRPSVAGWTVDRDALEDALHELDIRHPLRVVLTTGWRKIGNANVDRWGHRIRLSGRHPLERANRTLWHELAHAAQRERELRKLCLDYMDEGGRIFLMQISGRTMMGADDWDEATERDYRAGGATHETHPLELEARQVAADHEGRLLLCQITT